MAELRLERVCKRFGEVEAVSDVDLEIADGELAVLVGPSGCGKSTTLRMIAGLEAISSGEIRIGDRRVNDLPPRDRDIAMVFQSYALYPHMTVRDNLEFGLRMRRMPRAEIAERVQQAATLLGIEELLERRPKQLSGGQRQRVAMGRAIVRHPAVFLFDEPLSNLDAKLRGRMRTELSRLHDRLRTTTVYVTHDQVEAMTLADKIVVMNRGLVQQVGDPLELYQHPANRFVAGFIGTPAMNFIDGRLSHRNDHLAFVSDGLELPLPAALAARLGDQALEIPEVALGIRPTGLTLEAVGEAPGAGALQARVAAREPLGAEIYLHLASSCGDLVARVDAHSPLRKGDRVQVGLPSSELHLFDTLTETSLL